MSHADSLPAGRVSAFECAEHTTIDSYTWRLCGTRTYFGLGFRISEFGSYRFFAIA
jgi:hypothetical protein